MKTEDEFWQALAERPDDEALRLIFADWLLERGDPRGEAIVLGHRQSLSLTEKSRLRKLTQQHGEAWLGPLSAVADLSRCRFEAGFVVGLACLPHVDARRWAQLVGERRLATVRSLSFALLPPEPPVRPLLAHEVLRRLTHVRAPIALLEAMANDSLASRLETVGAICWGTGVDLVPEIAPMLRHRAFAHAGCFELVPVDIFGADAASAVRASIAHSLGRFAHLEELRVVADYWVVEGLAAWLNLAETREAFERRWPKGRRLSVAQGELRLSLERDGGASFERLVATLGGELKGLKPQVSQVLAVLTMLKSAKLRSIELRLPPSGKLTPAERDALRTAVRRMPGVQRLTVDGAPLDGARLS